MSSVIDRSPDSNSSYFLKVDQLITFPKKKKKKCLSLHGVVNKHIIQQTRSLLSFHQINTLEHSGKIEVKCLKQLRKIPLNEQKQDITEEFSGILGKLMYNVLSRKASVHNTQRKWKTTYITYVTFISNCHAFLSSHIFCITKLKSTFHPKVV